MNINRISLLLATGLAIATVPAALAQQGDEERVKKDLQTVLALQNKPCGLVTKADKKGENDYEVTCQTGDRYRIRIDENDRVTVTRID